MKILERIRCLLLGHHDARRYSLGGFRCRRCGYAGCDMADMGFPDSSYVHPLRRTFSREHGIITKSYGW
jgi:hypothetical protein